MSISDADIKILWGRANGRCSYCNIDLTMDLDSSSPIIIGEMAHIIARKASGPRGSEEIDPSLRNSYQNLILLCPTHHKMIDKAPSEYTVKQIMQWKKTHEDRIKNQSEGQEFKSKNELFTYSKKLLIENKDIHDNYGPNSFIAMRNPISNFSEIWKLRKVSTIIPNNTRIINAIEGNLDLLNTGEYAIFMKFKYHAISFESNTYERIDREGVPLFPKEFQELIDGEAFRL